MTHRFDWTSVLARVLFSFFIVFAVYNPSGHSFWHWFVWGGANVWIKLAVGCGLFGLHAVVITSVLGVLRWPGVLLVAVMLFGAWMAVLSGLGVSGWSGSNVGLMLLTGLSLVYAAGLSFPFFHYRLAGIAHVEKVH